MSPITHEVNIARFIALRVCREPSLKAWTVQRNCASGLQAIDAAACDIALGRYDSCYRRGTEAMSRSPLLLQDAMVEWLSEVNDSKSIPAKLLNLLKFRPSFLKQ